MDKELTPKQQTSEAIRQAESILIITAQHPSIDQVASTIALATILRKFGKKVTALISDEIPAGARFLPTETLGDLQGGLRDFVVRLDLSNAEVDKLRYAVEDGKLNIYITPFSGGFKQDDVSFSYGDFQFDLILTLGVASYSRLDKVYAQNADQLRDVPLVNIDFHRSNEQYGAVNLIEPTAASLAEILIALSESLQAGLIDSDIATTMLAGIMAATDRFTAVHTTSKTMTVAAQMMAAGADQQSVVRGLYRSGDGGRERSKQPSQSKPQAQPQPQQQSSPAPKPQPEPVAEHPGEQQQERPSRTMLMVSAPIRPQENKPEPQPVGDLQPEPELDSTDDLPDMELPMPAPAPGEPAPVTVPQPEPQPEPTPERHSPLEDLLPPQHIERSEAQDGPEPLINDVSGTEIGDLVGPQPPAHPYKAPNPTNNPTFGARHNEL